MPRPASAASHVPPTPPAPNFEAAMTELESLVQEMDEAQIPLETLLEKFTRGKTLLNFCQSRLDQAQQCVEMVSAQADGSATTQPFAVPASVGNAPPQDDIRLS